MTETKKALAITAGIAGVAGAAVLATAPNQAAAATTGTVTFEDGATTVWGSPAFDLTQVSRYVLHSETLKIQGQQTVDGTVWYQVGDNEWIPELYLQADGQAKADKAPVANKPVDATAINTPITPTYTEGAVTIWNAPSYVQPSGQYLTAKATAVATVKAGGETWYRLSNGGYVPARFAGPAGAAPQATPTQPAASAPVASQAPKAQASTTSAPTAQAPAQEATIANLKVTYTGSVVTEWADASYSKPTGKYLKAGNTVSAVAKLTVGGETWYRLSSGGYVPAQYFDAAGTALNQQNAEPTRAAASTPAPAPSTARQTPAPQAPQQPQAQAQAPKQAAPQPAPTPAPANTNRSVQVQAVINLAKAQLGKPYQWGARGPSSFDCSGLMQYVFNNALGRQIGSWTVPQESAGTRIAISSLQPGDLVFWGNAGNTYHVALYLGGGQYLHAPQPGENVKISSISQYFYPSFGVRVL